MSGLAGEALIQEVVAGRWHDPATGQRLDCPIGAIVTEPSLAGHEAGLVAGVDIRGRIAVVADENTVDVLGSRVAAAIAGSLLVVLDHPHADEATAAILAERARHADALVAVGGGTLNDLCKYVGFNSGRPCAVFGTAPSMNGFVTRTASLTRDGAKLSLPCQFPRGCFFDLAVLAAAPARLIRAGIGDAICRSTAQVDWLLSHLLFGTTYAPGAFTLQEADEAAMLALAADAVAGDPAGVAAVINLLNLSGLATIFTGSSHPGSMGEHSISHYLDMLAVPHPGSLHGEQVAVASRTMSRLQALLLADERPPRQLPTRIDSEAMRRRYGRAYGEAATGIARKALDRQGAERLNRRLESDWPELRERALAVMLPFERQDRVMRAAGLPLTGADLGLDSAFWREAVLYAREFRDRWSILDLAADAGLLEAFVAGES